MLQEDLEYDRRTVSSIDLDIADPGAAPRIAAEIRKSLGRDDLKVSDWQASMPASSAPWRSRR